MYKLAGYIALLEIAGLLGFVIVSRSQGETLTRFAPLLIALLVIGYIAYLKARMLSTKEIAYISFLASVIFIFVVQFLGFTIYPGLAKDLDFFSRENVSRTGLMLLIGTAGNFLLLTLVRRS